jgi:F0F1-type ATP synthase assembly protein I
MEPEILGLSIPILSVIGSIIVIMYIRRLINMEKMAMIEKGVSPEFFNIKKQRNTSGPLRTSLLFIGVGLGLFIGYFLDMHYNMEEVGYFAMLFILGGMGLGAAYLVEEKKIKEEKNSNP